MTDADRRGPTRFRARTRAATWARPLAPGWPGEADTVEETRRAQPIHHHTRARDHVNGDLVRRAGATDRCHGLVIANQDHDEIVVGVLADVAREGSELVGHRLRVAW